MSTSLTREQLTEAYAYADSVLALEGMVKPAGLDRLQQAVVDGEMTSEDAIASLLAKYTQAGHGGTTRSAS